MSYNFTNEQSTLVQGMAWCHQAPSHYLDQCWPRSMLPYGITKPQWVNPCHAGSISGRLKIQSHLLSFFHHKDTAGGWNPSLWKTGAHLSCILKTIAANDQTMQGAWPSIAMVLASRKTSSISRTKSQNLNVSCILLQLSSLNPLKPCVKLRMKM